MSDQPTGAEVEVVVDGAPEPLTPETVLPAGVQPTRNYVAAVELGRVMAASGFYKDARDPAKAAVKVMIGMDLGITPTAALQAVHVVEDKKGRVNILIEGKVFAALIKRTPGYDFKFATDAEGNIRRSETEVAIDFYREGVKVEPTIVWTIEKAKRAGLTSKGDTYTQYPAEMLTWRALAEGSRIHFPELLMGNPIYALEEFPEQGALNEASAPEKPQPLTDGRAEGLKAEVKAAYERLKRANPTRVPPGMYANILTAAEHSHARLEAEVGRMLDLAEREEEQNALVSRLEGLDLDPATVTGIVERAETRKVAADRVKVLADALAEHTPTEEGTDDAEAQS